MGDIYFLVTSLYETDRLLLALHRHLPYLTLALTPHVWLLHCECPLYLARDPPPSLCHCGTPSPSVDLPRWVPPKDFQALNFSGNERKEKDKPWDISTENNPERNKRRQIMAH